MRISVKLFATLAEGVPGVVAGEPFDFTVPDRTTLADLITRLDLPRDQTKLIFVNGRMQEADFHLKDGDEVGLFPPIGGG